MSQKLFFEAMTIIENKIVIVTLKDNDKFNCH